MREKLMASILVVCAGVAVLSFFYADSAREVLTYLVGSIVVGLVSAILLAPGRKS